jgi:hypothetical protein
LHYSYHRIWTIHFHLSIVQRYVSSYTLKIWQCFARQQIVLEVEKCYYIIFSDLILCENVDYLEFKCLEI